MTTYTRPKWGAIAVAVICGAGAGAILVQDGLKTGLTIDHILAVAAIVITIAAGHQATQELREWHLLRATGLAAVFLGGILFCVVSTAGRGIESQAVSAANARAANEARAAKVRDLERARQRKLDAERMADREMTGQSCKQRCQDWKLRASEVSDSILILEAQLARLGGEKPVDAKIAGTAALVAALTGLDETAIARTLSIAWPYVLPLLLELGSIVFWSIGLPRGRRLTAANDADSGQTSFPWPPKGPLPSFDPPPTKPMPPRRDGRDRGEVVRGFIAAYRGKYGHDPRTCEIVRGLGIPKAAASRWKRRAAA